MRQAFRKSESEETSLADEVRSYFIEKSAVEEAKSASAITTWREAGQNAAVLTVVGFLFFGIHFLVYGRAEGEFPRGALGTIFTVMTFVAGGETWKGRLRHLAAVCASMGLLGLYLRFVVRDYFVFSPLHIGVIAVLTIGFWAIRDRFRAFRRR